jgi:hypothetical protein
MGAMVLPEYSGGSLVNLIASLAEACGAAANAHAPLALLPAEALKDARNIVLVIVDGLGDGYLLGRGAGGESAKRRCGAITTVFPSTTASAITTTYTGLTPIEHGLTGWFAYFGDAGCVGSELPLRSRGDEMPLRARGVAPGRLYRSKPLFDALAVRSIVVSPRAIIDSDYNLHHCGRAERRPYDTLDGLVAETEAAVKSGGERKFVYVYWPDYDATAHRHGAGSREAEVKFETFDAAFGRLLGRLAGTESIVVLTADHGFIDSSPEESIELADGPGLQALLRFPLCGERRAAYCHVQEGRVAEFVARASDWLDGRADVHLSRELAAQGWFGPGAPHPRFTERIGDVTLVMRGRYTIKDWVPGEARHLHIGNHGGTSEDEMRIPLIIQRT